MIVRVLPTSFLMFRYAFLLTTPAVLLYWLAYFVIVRSEYGQDVHHGPDSSNTTRKDTADDTTPILQAEHTTDGLLDEYVNCKPHDVQTGPVRTDGDVSAESVCQRIMRCFRLVMNMAFNLSAVYVFEYVARGCAAKVRPSSEYHVGCPELYAALQLCYQILQIRQVGMMSILQFANMLLWIFDAHYKFIPVYLLPAMMVYVGLLGGASYVNIFYMILHEPRYPDRDRELCVNITAMFITLGIVFGTCIETALFTTVLKHD
ncbi:hypothetical protein BaRGS_00017257 [Batillaria attramentaria]|uniref:Battenin n=1 Tax=Batillaria attramentaria TaxID=370345 RepID=A0ABD0KW90_9CAEN